MISNHAAGDQSGKEPWDLSWTQSSYQAPCLRQAATEPLASNRNFKSSFRHHADPGAFNFNTSETKKCYQHNGIGIIH